MAAAQKVAGSLASKIPQLVKKTSDFATPKLQVFWRYAKVELRPPTFGEMPGITKGFNDLALSARSQKWKNLTVKQAWLNTLVGVEIACWFFVGECIGKGTIVGYQIPGATHITADF